MIDITGCHKFERDSRFVKKLLFLEVEWRRAYPLVDLQKQLGWAHAWLVCSGKKYTDMSRFLNNWFRRCQKDLEMANAMTGPIVMPKAQKYVEVKPSEDEVMSADDFKRMREAL